MNWKPFTTHSLVALAVAFAVAGCSSDDDDTVADDTDNAAETLALIDEATDGDSSNDPINPTPAPLVDGSITVSGSVVESNAPTGDLDYVTVNVPDGSQLSEINLVSYDSVSTQSFIGMQLGQFFEVLPDGSENEDIQASLLGFTLFGTNEEAANPGEDILPIMGTAQGAIGFTPPLSAGDYTFWIQETSPNEASYTFEFVVEPVPQ